MALPVVGGIFAGLAGVLVWVAGSIVARVIVGLGLAVVYYYGLDTAISWAHDQFFVNMNLLPPLALQLVGVLKIGVCIKLLFVTLGIYVTLKGMNAAGFHRWITVGSTATGG